MKEENGMLQDRMGQEETRRVVEQTSVRTRKVAQVEKVTGDTMEGVQYSEQEDESVGEEVTVQKSHDGGTQRSGKQAAKHIGWGRKLWRYGGGILRRFSMRCRILENSMSQRGWR